MVHPFSYREAADFWRSVGDPELSVMLHALVGGTPAYLDMSGTSGPGAVGELDDWVASALLNPGSAMFREGNILLAEEQGVTDAAAYLSVLAAISQGASRRGQIAAAVGRAEGALAHPLSVLTEAQLITPLADALKQRRTTFHVAEPVLRLHQLVVAPNEARLVRHQGSKVWSEVTDTVAARIYGPHFNTSLVLGAMSMLPPTPWAALPAGSHGLSSRVGSMETTMKLTLWSSRPCRTKPTESSL